MKSKIILLILSAMIISSPVFSLNTYAETLPAVDVQTTADNSEETYTVTFLDFDGNTMNTQELKSGETIDYSKPDTASLKYNVNAFTQRMFSEWDIHPETVSQDTTIQALYTEAVISLDSIPSKTLYSFDDTDVDSNGLKVTITISTQTTSFDSDGNRIMEVQQTDISSTCTLAPNNAKEAFKNSDSAEIKIYPISSSVPVGSYTINLDILRGDVNSDGKIDSSDASAVIRHYASYSIGVDDGFTELQKRKADFNRDGVVNASDSSAILKYYADSSSGKNT